ncbi:MAG: DUF1203 domain-containing protein [Acidobacteriota bacterium]
MFQIHALAAEPFRDLFILDDQELATRRARRMTVDCHPGYPCRVSLADAEIGERVILLHFEHLPTDSPYRSSHAIFVREEAQQAQPAPGELPEVLTRRLLSVRAFDRHQMMITADVVKGREAATAIETLFEEPRVDQLHLHYAKPGCFAARVTRRVD